MEVKVTLDAWAEVDVWWYEKHWDVGNYTLINYPDTGSSSTLSMCLADTPTTLHATQVTEPQVMGVPEIASGPNGEMLEVHIENITPNTSDPSRQVQARFWNDQLDNWGVAIPLSDGIQDVLDPTVAFVGSAGHALVAWTQNPMTPADYLSAQGDLSTILSRLEIYWTYWNGTTWSAPARLTDDLLPDGSATLAGDELGATLAWTTDIDGDIATRTSWRIAVTEWDDVLRTWGPVEILGGMDEAVNENIYLTSESLKGNSTVPYQSANIFTQDQINTQLQNFTSDTNNIIPTNTTSDAFSWVIETVDSGVYEVPQSSEAVDSGGDVGQQSSLQLNSEEYPSISYLDWGNHDSKIRCLDRQCLA